MFSKTVLRNVSVNDMGLDIVFSDSKTKTVKGQFRCFVDDQIRSKRSWLLKVQMALILKVGQSSKGLQLTSNTCTLFLFVHPFAVEECTSACMQTCTTMQFHLIFIILWFISNFVRTHQHNSFSFFNCGVVYQYSICVCVWLCHCVCV